MFNGQEREKWVGDDVGEVARNQVTEDIIRFVV